MNNQTAINQTHKEAALRVENNRYFVITVIFGIITILSIIFAIWASLRDVEVKMVWIKMYRDGSWDVDVQSPLQEKDFFKDTIDKELITWVTKRYQEVPYSVKSDYGYVYNFMSPEMKSNFNSATGFNAIEKASKIASCESCDIVRVSVRSIDHYDSDLTKFGKFDGTLYRSNIFITLTYKNPHGSKEETENMIVSMKWRVKSKEEIEADKILKESIKNGDLTLIKLNPVGLEILESDIMKDRSKS